MIQAQPKQNNKFVELPINRGERPDWQPRINYPKLFNMFVGESGYVYTDPGLSQLSADAPDDNTRAIWRTFYQGVYDIVVTNTQILKIASNGASYDVIAEISNSGQAVQIDENEQHQIIIVDGRNAYVYAQEATPPSFTVLSSTQGFEFTSPISVTVLNNIAIILDATTNSWAVSDPNNALNWPVLDYILLDSTLTQGVSLETLGNNLFIFGTTGIERWVPNTGNNTYLFPFDKDTSYRQDFGAISTNGVIRGFNEIYFQSSKYVPMSLSLQGLTELADADYRAGLAKILSNYPDADKCQASFYTFKGNYFFTMSFVESGDCWRWCVNSKTYSRGDDLIISALRSYQVVATPNGIFNLVEAPQENKKREIVLDNARPYKGQQPSLTSLLGIDVQMLQGYLHNTQENLELSFSLDGQQVWTNIVTCPIGKTGERNAQTTWKMNITCKQYASRITYFGNLEFTITNIFAIVR